MWKNIDYGKREGEFQYINVERKIFAEIYLKDDIEDYKIYCFHGEPKLIRVQKWGKPGMGKINNYYTMDWKLTDLETGKSGFYRDPDANFEKPPNYDLMLSYAKKLSAEFVFVRVDFYDFNNTVYLGEMTFTPSNKEAVSIDDDGVMTVSNNAVDTLVAPDEIVTISMKLEYGGKTYTDELKVYITELEVETDV